MVFNWQINREMNYPYPAKRPNKQFAGVFDLNKCIACQTCTLACKTTWTSARGQEYMWWNNVESKPRGGYPIAWDLKLMEKLGDQKWEGDTYKGKTVFEGEKKPVEGYLPEDMDYAYPNLGEDEINQPLEDKGYYFSSLPAPFWMFYLPRICNHCTYPACLAACPRRAIYKREEDGIVLVDQERCRGYRYCVEACPYKKVFFNAITRISEKCIGCFPLIENGRIPRCFETCIGKIRIFGFLGKPDNFREDNPIDYLVFVRKVALPLYPQSGTEPNIYYIPPINVPLSFLRMIFGPNSDNAVKIYRDTMEKARSKGLENLEEEDLKLIGLITLANSTNKIVYSFKILKTTLEIVAYDRNGGELIKVPIREPQYIREFYDRNLEVFRYNIT
ncbi:Selenate reductase subunit beta [archaeon HR06]|nr:Selenate reductase subunit beta [archaeon HR06]